MERAVFIETSLSSTAPSDITIIFLPPSKFLNISCAAASAGERCVVPPYHSRSMQKGLVPKTHTARRYGGTTHLSPALAAAHEMLRNFDGGRNIIVISDGAVDDSDVSIKTARSMSDDGITIYAIGVGGIQILTS